MSERDQNVDNRQRVIDFLRAEMVGPQPTGELFDVDGAIPSVSVDAVGRPYRQAGSGEEILKEKPTTRYGVGVLFPQSITDEPIIDTGAHRGDEAEPVTPGHALPDSIAAESASPAEDDEDLDLSRANAYTASSLAISFVVRDEPGHSLQISGGGGRYQRRDVRITGDTARRRAPTWWFRVPVTFRATLALRDVILSERSSGHRSYRLSEAGEEAAVTATGVSPLELSLQVFARRLRHRSDVLLVTVCLINDARHTGVGKNDEMCLFQAGFRVSATNGEENAGILPFEDRRRVEPRETEAKEEAASLELLYRDRVTFATGHGTSVDWKLNEISAAAEWVAAECFPTATTRGLSPNIRDRDGQPIVVRMADLSALAPGSAGWGAMDRLTSEYERWIDERRAEVEQLGLDERLRGAATRNLDECVRALARMREGIALLEQDPMARRAFELANEAINFQQVASRSSRTIVAGDRSSGSVSYQPSYREPEEWGGLDTTVWRAFQIGFLLVSIVSTIDPLHRDREMVDLIWFPTGGGKTEAYLGLAAFATFHRRLMDPDDTGVSVLMRYTLRLLTSQQFERASSLICAMEVARRRNFPHLGRDEMSIGIWVGVDTTPNTREQAVEAYKQLSKGDRQSDTFVLRKCPWCGLDFKVDATGSKRPGISHSVRHLKTHRVEGGGTTVLIHCPDPECEFGKRLPVHVVDEDVYAARPTLVIGTIDKFARLAWIVEPRALFGLGANGKHDRSPPGLIIQDELHLIAGPLGSIAGLYETVIEELCVDRRSGCEIRPKIVASTATIRRSKAQVKALYDRSEVSLFPPSGINATDSFFARESTDEPGKIYVGVHAPSLGSVQTEWVRTFSALHHAPMEMPPERRDPWWTNLSFYNSIREMGTSHTLYDTDVRDYLGVIWKRLGTEKADRRYVNSLQELIGGLSSDQMKQAMDALQTPFTEGRRAIDVCLASNVIEVGLDISRLSLMTIAGQPKTTAQYIQVSGRVGRDPERPGLIVTLYSPSKPRDRSHYERFRSYHERLYAQVEPTSVTPFSPPAIDRALHAVLVIHARYLGGDQPVTDSRTVPDAFVQRARDMVLARCQHVDPSERPYVEAMIELRISEWKRWEKLAWTRWDKGVVSTSFPLLNQAGDHLTEDEARFSWPTPTSMRNVDAGCEAVITMAYVGEQEV